MIFTATVPCPTLNITCQHYIEQHYIVLQNMSYLHYTVQLCPEPSGFCNDIYIFRINICYSDPQDTEQRIYRRYINTHFKIIIASFRAGVPNLGGIPPRGK